MRMLFSLSLSRIFLVSSFLCRVASVLLASADPFNFFI